MEIFRWLSSFNDILSYYDFLDRDRTILSTVQQFNTAAKKKSLYGEREKDRMIPEFFFEHVL